MAIYKNLVKMNNYMFIWRYLMNFNMRSIILVSLVGVASVCVSFGFLLYNKLNNLTHFMHYKFASIDEYKQIKQNAINKVSTEQNGNHDSNELTTSILWRPIQERVKDTVVQVYAQVAAIDLLQPYKTPSQGVATGSGFFIDESGYLVTNAHVVLQAKAVWIQIPSLGKTIIDVEIVGLSPDRDLALLKLTDQGKAILHAQLGKVPVLPLGNSDYIYRSEEVLALGYPLGQMSLKSTTGVVSGRERNFIQISAPINPGNSGGPLVNVKGEVVGINSAGIFEAQNVGYAIPINDLKLVLDDLKNHLLLRKAVLGIFFNNGSFEMVQYLNNPLPGGCYVNGVLPGSPAERAGVQPGDMIYEINGHKIDLYGDMQIAWSEDKVSVVDYAARLPLGKTIKLLVYRNGIPLVLETMFDFSPQLAIKKVYPGFENIDYEVFGGMVIMPLTMNHINLLVGEATGLAQFIETHNQQEPQLIVTHILPNSQTHRVRAINIGSVLKTVNNREVKTLDEFRKALLDSIDLQYIRFTFKDMVFRTDKDFLLVLDYAKVLAQEQKFSLDYCYPLSNTVKQLIKLKHEK